MSYRKEVFLGIAVGLAAVGTSLSVIAFTSKRPTAIFTCRVSPSMVAFTKDSPGYVAIDVQNNTGDTITVNNAKCHCPCIQPDPGTAYPLTIPPHTNRVLLFGAHSRSDDINTDVLLYVEAGKRTYIEPITLTGRKVE